MNNVDKEYFILLDKILKNGTPKSDRTGTGTISIFSHEMRFNFKEGFPILTSKKVFFKAVVLELIWFLRGETNIKWLVDRGVHIWDGDAYKNYTNKIPMEYVVTNSDDPITKSMISRGRKDPLSGYSILERMSQSEFIDLISSDESFAKVWGELGPVYGKQWRDWESFEEVNISGPGLVEPSKTFVRGHVDQIKNLISDLMTDPDSRRLIVSAWNPGDIPKMVLPPCHNFFQCWTRELTTDERIQLALDRGVSKDDLTDKKLDSLRIPKRYNSMKVNIRSNDIFLGCPFNITSYALLLEIISREVNMIPLELIISIGDAHIYKNHIDLCKMQLNQETFDLPKLKISDGANIFDLKLDDFQLIDYKSSPKIKGELSN